MAKTIAGLLNENRVEKVIGFKDVHFDMLGFEEGYDIFWIYYSALKNYLKNKYPKMSESELKSVFAKQKKECERVFKIELEKTHKAFIKNAKKLIE